MAAESLQAACELAYAVARDDAESEYLAEPPASMRSFLYVSDLPRRAITVAQQAIEDDSEFRARVAARATEDTVGRAGYLWLQRPPGWAAEFEELTAEAEEAAFETPEPDPELEDVYQNLTASPSALPPIVAVPDLLPVDSDPADEQQDFAFDPGATFSPESPPIADAPMATVSPITGSEDPLVVPPPPTFETTSLGTAAVTDRAEYEAIDTNFTAIGDADGDILESTEMDFEADALESELSSLRGLVDRLAGERDTVVSNVPGPTSVESLDAEISGRVLESELMALESDLEAARHELSLAQTDLASARHEREEAQRLHSETLKRQVDLEKELATVREERQDIESQASESQVSVISLEEKLTRVTNQLEEADRERNVVRSQLETMTSERNHIREDRALLKAERDDLATKMADVEEKSGGVDIGELTASNRTLTAELDTTSRELARMIAQAESFEEQIKTSTTAADSLKTEKIELTSRLADTELALETTRTQHEALKSDSERLAAEVGTLRAERDGLQSQLTELQASLADVLSEQAEIRQRNDADRKALNELRVERDVLMARMADLEQADRDYDVKLKALVKERDDLVVARDELIAERGQIRAEMAGFVAERDQTIEQLGDVQSQIGPLETELQAERRQREELANRLLELDDIAERNTADLGRLSDERNELAAAVEELRTERIEVNEIRVERDNLAVRLEEADRRFEDEDARNRVKLTELSEQLAAGETARNSVEQRLAETLGELDTMRLEYEEVNKEVARLSVIEDAHKAAEAAAAEAAAAAAIAAAAVPSAIEDTSEAVETAAVQPLSGDITAPSVLPKTGDADIATPAADVTTPAMEEIVSSAPDTVVAPSLSPVEPVGDISQEVPVVEFPKPDDRPGTTQPTDNPFAWPPPAIGAPDGGETGTDWKQAAADATSTTGIESPIGDVDTALGVGTGTDIPEEDDLDEVSELISQTVSSFSDDPAAPSVLPDLGNVAEVADVDTTAVAADDTGSIDSPPSVVDDLPDDSTQAIPQISAVPPSIFGTRSADDDQDAGAAVRRQPGGRRRQIEIPSDILDDEVAVAQFVVSSPDVVLLVDGDSVAKLGWPSLLVAEQRDALVTYLADLSASSGAAPDVVFDGRIGDDDSLPASRAVRIRLSTPPTEPAAALDELVDAYPDQWPIALVTDDKSLADSASERGAAVLNNGQLLDLFIAQ